MTREDLLQKFKEPIQVGKYGYVQLVDVMGTDADIATAARTSYGKGTRQVSEDRNLIRYLMRHRHTSPFEMCEIKFQVKVPIDTWRQWIRHRTASVNEYSTRYSEALDEMESTDKDKWRLQATNNKQGSSGYLAESDGFWLSLEEADLHEQLRRVYKQRLKLGVAREQARKDLPLCNYTQAVWKIDLHNLFNFLKLRLDSHAQQEIREFAEAIASIVKEWVPMAWEAFDEYVINSVTLNKKDIQVLNSVSKLYDAMIGILKKNSLHEEYDSLRDREISLLSEEGTYVSGISRESVETVEKLRKLGFTL